MTDMIERFWEKIDKRRPDECWPWTGTLQSNRSGQLYGYFRAGKMVRVNRLMWRLHNQEEIPHGQVVRHTCDNTVCCNPAHLVIGTQKQNVSDRYERNRASHYRGEKHALSKLTEADVLEIRAALASGQSQRAIAAQFGISQFGVQYARDGWKHV